MNTLFEMPIQQKTNEPYHGRYIYETKGRAREYRELAANLYTGCDHGCKYCYAPDILRRDRRQFYTSPKPRTNIIEKIRKDARGYMAGGDKRQVLFCFACDPYPQAHNKYHLTTEAIQVLHYAGMSVSILTKGGKRSQKDLKLLGPKDSYAVTLTTCDDKLSKIWEPGAAVYTERLEVLKEAYGLGITTWVSLEPVLNPAWTLKIIEETHDFVNQYKVGPLNYHKAKDTINWYQFTSDVIKTLEKFNANYYLKRDLRKFIRA